MFRKAIVTAVFGIVALSARASLAAPDWNAVAAALGKSGTEIPGGIYRVGLPRTDLSVTLDGVTLKPALALGSWLAFAPMGNKAVVMGDLVLTEEEVSPVMKKLAEKGIEITALHNHLFRAIPATFYMHVFGEGEAVTLARELHEALMLSKTPLSATPPSSALPTIDLDTAAIDHALGATGKIASGVYQVGIPRSASVTERGDDRPSGNGIGRSDQFSADRKGQSGHHRRLCSDGVRGKSGASRTERTRDRGDGSAQSHVGGTAAAILHALLGQ